MDFSCIIDDICCDDRLKDGIPDLNNLDFCFLLQEYLVNKGISIEEVVEKTSILFEKGNFPDRQAYNKNGILVTFPNKEYRDRAVNKGTHSIENPKKQDPNIFTDKDKDSLSISDIDIEKKDSDPDDENLTLDDYIEDEINDINLDLRTKQEKELDGVGVVSILDDDPLSSEDILDLDEVIHNYERYGMYGSGKNWYNSDGKLVGEQYYDESLGKCVIKILEKNDKNLSKAQKVVDKLNSSNTPILETLPLILPFLERGDASVINKFDLSNQSKEWSHDFNDVFGFIKNNEKLLKRINTIGGEDKNLFDIGGPYDDVIHDSIKKYYRILKNKTNIDNESKENTADVVLIYGTDHDNFLEELDRIKDETDLKTLNNGLIKIKGKNISFAQISLKAGQGRLGKITKKFLNMVRQISLDENTTSFINENGFGNLLKGLKNIIDDSYNVLKGGYKFFLKKIDSVISSVYNIFSRIPVKDIERENRELFINEQAFEISNEQSIISLNTPVEEPTEEPVEEPTEEPVEEPVEEPTEEPTEEPNEEEKVNSLNEVSSDIPITSCNFSEMKNFYNLYKKSNFEYYINELSNNVGKTQVGGVILDIMPIDEKSLLLIDENIENIWEIFNNAMLSINEGRRKTCVDTGKFITREKISPVLKFRANHIALRKINELIKSIKIDNSIEEFDQKIITDLTSELSSEAVFGNNISLPLWKFTGNNLYNLGTRSEYKTKVMDKLRDSKFKDLPPLIFKITETRGEKLHYQVKMYLLFDIEINKGEIDPKYQVVDFTVGSGSKFVFNVEATSVVSFSKIKV